MTILPFLAIAAITPAPSGAVSLTPVHLRDIGCVAVMAIIAEEQNRGAAGVGAFPAARLSGRKWAGIVGERVADQTGQPIELIGFAMREAAKGEQAALQASQKSGNNRNAALSARYADCAPLMRADLENDLASRPLPVPQSKPAKKP
jgi:hypothetical protein